MNVMLTEHCRCVREAELNNVRSVCIRVLGHFGGKKKKQFLTAESVSDLWPATVTLARVQDFF